MSSFATASDFLSGVLDLGTSRRWRFNAWMIGLFLIVVASIVSSLSYTAKADRDIDRQFTSKLTLYREQAERINQLDRLKNLESDFAAQAAVDASLIDAAPRSRALAEIDNALPPGIRLAAISLEAQTQASEGAAQTAAQTIVSESPADDAAKVLRIKGAASSDSQLSQFVGRLGRSPWFQRVNLLPAIGNTSNGTQQRTFEVQAIFSEHADSLQASALR